MAKTKIYGWEKQLTKDSYMLEATLDNRKFKIIDKITGEVIIDSLVYLVYNCEARWFTNFNEAKKAMMNDLLLGIQWREEIIKKMRNKK